MTVIEHWAIQTYNRLHEKLQVQVERLYDVRGQKGRELNKSIELIMLGKNSQTVKTLLEIANSLPAKWKGVH